MKKYRSYAKMLISLILVSGLLCNSLNVYAEPIDTEVIPTDSRNTIVATETLSTGTQENAKENTSNVDEDINEEIEALIPIEWEEIEISTAEDLCALAKNCSLDTWSRNKYVILKNDISLYESDFLTIPTFGGVFDGQNHTISHYYMSSGQNQIGLFADVQKQGLIKNLNVSARIMPSGSKAIIGGIAGDNSGIIMGCSFKGIIEARDYVGGIAGINRLEGIISDCKSEGVILGVHFTGGIAGENMGNIIRCTNKSEVNTTEQETSMSLEDIDIDSYLQLFSLKRDSADTDSTSKTDDIVDVGGIAGLSIGVIEYCTNDGPVGYEKIGYNVGGIVGRQSGYVYSCNNKGEVLGRKDVGGIVGQAEPYVTIDFTQDIVYQLSENIGKLHDIIAVTLNDVDGSSDTISNRLAVIQQFTNGALADTDYLASSSVDWVDGMVGSANEVIGRADYIINETAKQGGIIDQAKAAAGNMSTAGTQIANALGALDVYQYMTPEQQLEYQNYQNALADINREYTEYLANATVAYRNFYLDDIRHYNDGSVHPVGYTQKDGTTTNYWGTAGVIPNEQDLAPKKSGSTTSIDYVSVISNPLTKADNIYLNYKDVEEWVHIVGGTEAAFPASESGEQRDLDIKLQNTLNDCASDISKDANDYASSLYSRNHGSLYKEDVADYSLKMAGILNSDNVRGQMTDDTKAYVDSTIGYVENARDDLTSAANSSKDVLNNLIGRGSVTLPSLGEDYKAHTTSLNNNLQGMSDNFGYLNQEMSSSTDTLVTDLSAVNDQFNVIMMLYTDAIDGVLDNDYSNTIEDNSLEVAEVCTDATIDSCRNSAKVSGALDVSGIAGTMAIEYDYDLESDVTGIKDATLNTTYLTKCVLRDNTNSGLIIAEKSYVAGICGLQEMGTIYRCGNYEKITSASGGYVGGIAGSSLSDIVSSYSKCILEGKTYVGGIAGKINNASSNYSWVNIPDAEDYYGAIAGDVTSEGRIRDNFFLSSELAGVNRISYSRKAEPISYDVLSNEELIPQAFKDVRIVFLLEDEDVEDTCILGEEYIQYGEKLNPAKYPIISPKDGYYTVWDANDENVYVDMEIIASYERNTTTLASDMLRDSKQSALLVDGRFLSGDKLNAYLDRVASDQMDNMLEYWNIEIPDDGSSTHQIRYSLPDTVDIKKENMGIYYLANGEWTRVAEVNTMGKYYTFDVPGNIVNLQIVNETKGLDRKIIVIIASAIGALVVLSSSIILFKKFGKKTKKKNRKKSETEKIKTKE